MRLGYPLLALAAVGGLLAGSAAVAQEKKATGVVAVRQSTMKAQADHMNAIKAILTEYPQLLSNVSAHADAIHNTSQHIPEMFPQGSDQPPTEALPAIWKDPQGFKTAAQHTEELAKKLRDTAAGGNAQATLAAFAELGKNGCGGCHEKFRKKEQ
jgi:cytochrome c556